MDNNEPTINVKLTEEDLSLIRQVLKVIVNYFWLKPEASTIVVDRVHPL